MERDNDIVELGAASIETKGPRGPDPDIGLGVFKTGLADD